VTLLQLDASRIHDYYYFRLAQGVGVIFVGKEDALFRIHLESGQVRKEDCGDRTVDVIPYMSFYVPGTTLLIVYGFSISRT